MLGLSRLDQLELRVRVARVEETDLGRRVARGGDDQEIAAPRALDPEVEALVLLLVDELVLRRIGPEDVLVELVRALRLCVLGHVEDRLVVGREGDRVDPLGAIREIGTGAKVLHVERELAEARGVEPVGVQVAVVGDVDVADADERLGLRDLVRVDQDHLGRAGARLLSAADGVLLPLLRARVILPPVEGGGRRRVGLLQARDGFVVDLPRERREARGHRVRVRVLRLEIGDDLGGPLVAQPGVVVLEGLAVDRRLVRVSARDRRGDGRGGGGGVGGRAGVSREVAEERRPR